VAKFGASGAFTGMSHSASQAARCVASAASCSTTIRTARVRTSGENRVGLGRAHPLKERSLRKAGAVYMSLETDRHNQKPSTFIPSEQIYFSVLVTELR